MYNTHGSVYTHTCIQAHIHIVAYIYVYTHTHTHTHIYIYIYRCVSAYVHMYVHVSIDCHFWRVMTPSGDMVGVLMTSNTKMYSHCTVPTSLLLLSSADLSLLLMLLLLLILLLHNLVWLTFLMVCIMVHHHMAPHHLHHVSILQLCLCGVFMLSPCTSWAHDQTIIDICMMCKVLMYISTCIVHMWLNTPFTQTDRQTARLVDW